jgi:hypothetical protein
MKSQQITPTPICECGSKDFKTLSRGRNRTGRMEYRLICRKCGQERKVSKSTYALFNYLGAKRPTKEFLKIYDLS